MVRTPQAWPPALVGTPAVMVIERAIEADRLGHSLLLHGDDLEMLAAAARAIADRLLDGPPLDRHPDFFTLRPAKKMRQISADDTRSLIGKVHKSTALESRKVAVIHEADRMHPNAAAIFLKTLEEPPAHTVLILLTTHPYALLPTIRSRCLHFRLTSRAGADPAAAAAAPWRAWLADYAAWHERIVAGTAGKQAVADHIFSVYGLVARFKAILEAATDEAWAREKAALPPDIPEDEQVAIETGLAKGIRARFFTAIEEATLAFAAPRLAAGDAATRRAFTAAIGRLERDTRLFAYNLNEAAALEDFLLASLRLWSRR